MWLSLILVICSDPGISLYRFNKPPDSPIFIDIAPTTQSSAKNPVVRDIESRLDNPEKYNDLITYVHEGTHSINSAYRNKYGGRNNALYELNGKLAVALEPSITLRLVAESVPGVLRGSKYYLYMQQQQKYWNDRPLYIFDEWVAYLNGLEVAVTGSAPNNRDISKDIEATAEFFVYAAVLCEQSYTKYMNGRELRQVQAIMFWHTRRMLMLLHKCRKRGYDCSKADKILLTFRKSLFCIQLRIFTSAFLGKQWCKINMGF